MSRQSTRLSHIDDSDASEQTLRISSDKSYSLLLRHLAPRLDGLTSAGGCQQLERGEGGREKSEG